jgi:hypothetical protein
MDGAREDEYGREFYWHCENLAAPGSDLCPDHLDTDDVLGNGFTVG